MNYNRSDEVGGFLLPDRPPKQHIGVDNFFVVFVKRLGGHLLAICSERGEVKKEYHPPMIDRYPLLIARLNDFK